MNKFRYASIPLLIIFSGCSYFQSENEEDIPLSQVPVAVLNAAEQAVTGIKLLEAEIEEEDGQMIYELEGTVGDKEYEIEVSTDGKVLDVEEKD